MVVDILNDDIVHDDVVNDDDVNDDDAEEGRVHHRFFESMIFFSRNLVKVFYKIKNADKTDNHITEKFLDSLIHNS